MSNITRKLILKELARQLAWSSAGLSWPASRRSRVAALGQLGFSIGSLIWLSTIIGMGVVLALYGDHERAQGALARIHHEPAAVRRRLRARQDDRPGAVFPHHLGARGGGGAGSWCSPRTACPTASRPTWVLLSVFMLANFCVVLCGTMFSVNGRHDHCRRRHHQHGRVHFHVHRGAHEGHP
jgi:hypothetical protein